MELFSIKIRCTFQLVSTKPYHVFYLCYKQLCDMAKLYINKDIVADKDKMENWYLTGDEGLFVSGYPILPFMA